ncbi:MAG: hypothetical protein E6K53_06910 [Gammaproteobacteria bacterium]|nr:MAG: hypothetical protein E6K53_06910 [Gammaproteobacteria bacterium]
MKRTTLIAATFAAFVSFSDMAGAQVAVQRQLGSTSKLVVKLVSGQVVEVNKNLGTFKLAAGKQAYIFTYKKLSRMPTFGDEVNVSYAESSSTGPMDALTIKSVD